METNYDKVEQSNGGKNMRFLEYLKNQKYDRSGEEPFQSIPGDRYGNNPVRSSGCHGALPELYF